MYLKIRNYTTNHRTTDVIITISKMSLIQELRTIIHKQMQIETDRQRLYYKGKQLIDDHRIMDYDIQLNDVIQLMIKSEDPSLQLNRTNESFDGEKENEDPSTSKNKLSSQGFSKYFKVADAVDYIDLTYGAWFEAHVEEILQTPENNDTNIRNKEPNLIFRLKMDTEIENIIIDVTFEMIRPRSFHLLNLSELTVDTTVLVNYNIEQPLTRGYWYDFIIKKISSKTLKGTILVGKNSTPLENCTIKYTTEILQIEKPVLRKQHLKNTNELPPIRKTIYYCEACKDVAKKLCKECGCKICAGKEDVDRIILCDECDYGFHTMCLTPPLPEVPSDPEWYCPDCKIDENEIVKAGDKLKFSNKKSKMASAKKGNSTRDWGRGMACVGRTKECTIVPKDHYGPIPGIDVGTCWKYRLQVSEAGIHRPHVAGIHGRETAGAFSLVLSGGYEDDVDKGDEFIYSGSGGRDLSGNKRVSDQSCDQTLTRLNKALALNCNVPLDENGAEATDWKAGKPVRVVRNHKLYKCSKYAPIDGNRYDGIYKVVKYYPEKGKSGYLVWKYLLRRDDPTPAPWSQNGKELEMLYPPGFLEAQADKKKISESDRGVKRSAKSTPKVPTKKRKLEAYKISQKIENLILSDEGNEKYWNECKECLEDGQRIFLLKVEQLFSCVCCQEVVYLPVSTECGHNVCQSCLKRSFASEIYCCPNCRFELGSNFKMNVNKYLSEALLGLFPGYEAHR